MSAGIRPELLELLKEYLVKYPADGVVLFWTADEPNNKLLLL